MALIVEAGELVEQFQWLKESESFDPAPEHVVIDAEIPGDLGDGNVRLLNQ